MENKEYQKLASEFIDMWQTQLETVVTDKQFVSTMFQGLQQMANYATPKGHERSTPTTTDAVDERLSELDFRVRMLEERLSKLEAKPRAKKSGGAAAKKRPAASASKSKKPAKRST